MLTGTGRAGRSSCLAVAAGAAGRCSRGCRSRCFGAGAGTAARSPALDRPPRLRDRGLDEAGSRVAGSMPSTVASGIALPISASIAATNSPSSGVARVKARAGHAGPAGAADAMDVILGMDRHVEIEDVGQALDVEPARRDVARHQELDLAGLELLQRLGAVGLRHVAVQRRGVEAVLDQRAIEDVDVALAVAEDERVLYVLARISRRSASRLSSCSMTMRPAHGPAGEAGGDTVISLGFVRNASASRRISAAWWPRRTASGGSRQQSDDPLDIGDEAHVEHAVGLIDHQDLTSESRILPRSNRSSRRPGVAINTRRRDRACAPDRRSSRRR